MAFLFKTMPETIYMILIVIVFVVATSVLFACLSKRFEKSVKGKEIEESEKRPLVSILIPTYNSEKVISKTLESIKNSNYPNKEVIVINDTDDKTPEIAKSFGAKVIQNTKRMGKGYALNVGSKKAMGEFLLFLDSDAVLEKDTLSKLVFSYYHHKKTDPKTVMIVPEYTANNQHILPAKISHLEQCTHQSWIKAQMNLGSILSIRGSCLLLPKTVFEEIEGFKSTVLEDGDFAARIQKAGYTIKYEPRACVGIAEPETFREFLRAKKRYGKGTLFCALRHKGTYLGSRHAALSFYPGFLIIAATILFLITTPAINLAVTIALLLLIPALAGLHIKFTSKNMSHNDHYVKIMSISLMPVIIAAYLWGVASGTRDKLTGKPEIKFQDW